MGLVKKFVVVTPPVKLSVTMPTPVNVTFDHQKASIHLLMQVDSGPVVLGWLSDILNI
jgi:hypothetical protein